MTQALRLAALSALLGAACSAPPEVTPPPPALRTRIDFDRTGTLPELIDHLRTLTGAPLVLVPEAVQLLQDPSARHALNLRDATGESVLRWILAVAAWGLEFAVQDGIILVDHPRRLHPAVQRFHDIRGVDRPPSYQEGGALALASPGTIGLTLVLNEIVDSPVGDEQLLDFVKESVRPGTWEGDQTIERIDPQRVLVTAAPAVHDEVAWLLDALRSFAPPTISVTADLVDADAPLASGSPVVLSPAEADALTKRLRARNSAPFTVSGLDSGRFCTQRTRSTSRLFTYQANGDPLLGTWLSDATVLDVFPTLVDGGRAVLVELRLSLGQSRELEPRRTPAGPLPLQERTVARLRTTFLVPNGGAVLFSLPSKNPADARPQLCLLRAGSDDPRARAPRKAAVRPGRPVQRELLDRLENAPAVDVDFKNVPLGQVVAWLRAATGLNWLLEPGLESKSVTLRAPAVPVARILPFLLKPLDLDFTARDDAFLIGSRERVRPGTELALIDTRDALAGAADLPAPGRESQASYTGEDLANLIKNTLHRDRWEEADGHWIGLSYGALVVRNAPDVVRDCLAFVDGEKKRKRRAVSLRADLLDVPEAAAGTDPFLTAAQVSSLIAAAGPSRERLAWQAQDGQRSSLCWDRALDYLEDSSGNGTKVGTHATSSVLELTAHSNPRDGAVGVRIRAQDQRIVDVREEAGLQLPIPDLHDVSTALSIPAGRTAAFRWPLPGKTVRVLLLQATLLPPIP